MKYFVIDFVLICIGGILLTFLHLLFLQMAVCLFIYMFMWCLAHLLDTWFLSIPPSYKKDLLEYFLVAIIVAIMLNVPVIFFSTTLVQTVLIYACCIATEESTNYLRKKDALK